MTMYYINPVSGWVYRNEHEKVFSLSLDGWNEILFLGCVTFNLNALEAMEILRKKNKEQMELFCEYM